MLPSRVRVRYRLLIWLDEGGSPEQVAVAKYIGDDKSTESTWEPGPFDTVGDVADDAVRTLDIQLRLL